MKGLRLKGKVLKTKLQQKKIYTRDTYSMDESQMPSTDMGAHSTQQQRNVPNAKGGSENNNQEKLWNDNGGRQSFRS